MHPIRISSRRPQLALLVLALPFSACSANGGLAGGTLAPASRPAYVAPVAPARRPPSSNPIKHVVIVVQENRSFNNLFYGFPGATTAKYGYDSHNKKVTIEPISLATGWDLEHDSFGFEAACNGTGSIPGTDCRMNGFDKEYVGCQDRCQYPEPMYAYVPHKEIKPYFDLAHQYVLADQMYASNFDASSFISHQYIIAAQAESAVNFPDGDWGCPGGPGDTISMVGPQRQVPDGYEIVCWNPTTLGDELDKAGLSWGFYTATINGDFGLWSAYQAIKHIYRGPDWKKDVITPQTKFFDDVSSGNLRAVSWITPTWENSDHAGSNSLTGPQWVASLVNAIGDSQYWKNTAIFIFWDDYGGWYDPEPPAYADYDGLGMRLPMLIVSAYAKKGHVSHVHYEHGTILKFIEKLFGLSAMAAADQRANAPDDAFAFDKPPRAFKTVPTVLGKDFFMHQPTSGRAPDDN